jgi:hypothetical protein
MKRTPRMTTMSAATAYVAIWERVGTGMRRG